MTIGLCLIVGMSGALSGCGQASSQTGPPPQPEPLVVFDRPITQTVTDYEEFPGRTEALYTINVTSRVSGYLNRVYFQDGQEVHKGDLLFMIDPRPFQAALDRSKATLQQAEAHSRRLGNEFRRAKALYEQGRSISREEFDRYAFDYSEAEAALSTAQASLDLAKLDLDWTNVTADLPDGMVGRLGRRLVDPGNLIKADETMMTSIITQDPLYVYFDVHEQAMLRIRRLIHDGKVKARSEKEVTVQISLSDERDAAGNPLFPHQGTVDFTDNRVDANTGTLRFRAVMPNPNRLITPGLFVRVKLPIGEPHPAVLVREQAIQSDQGLKKVFVLLDKDENGEPYVIKDPVTGKPAVDKQGKVVKAYKPATRDVGVPGVLRDGFREVSQGLQPDDLVVTLGMQKIRLGKNPVTGADFLVKARPFDPEVDGGSPPPIQSPASPPAKPPAATASASPGNGSPATAKAAPLAPGEKPTPTPEGEGEGRENHRAQAASGQ